VTVAPPAPSDTSLEDDADSLIHRQVRSSTLLVAGRHLSVLLGLVIQILIVRELAKSSFGAFAYVLSLVTFGVTFATFGLDRAINRFVPIYEERREYDKLFGTITLALGTVIALGGAEVAVLWAISATRSGVGGTIGSLLPILMLVAPLQAIDAILVGLLAVLTRARLIFLRSYLLAPGLRLLVVVIMVIWDRDVLFLARGYVLAEAVGLVVCAGMLYRAFRVAGLLAHFRPAAMVFPAREVFALTIPLLTTDLVYVGLIVSDALFLEHFRGAAQVANLKAVQPAAGLSQLVILGFTPLFIPLASRFFARNAGPQINDLYWRTASWIGVLSFPIFAVCFLLARPLTVAAFGSRYASSATLLSILALGFYVQSALGFNGTTLMVFGRVRSIVTVNTISIAVNIALNAWLIWRYGALGAAIGTTASLIVHNLLKQVALALGTSVRFFDPRYVRVYSGIAVGVGALVAIRLLSGNTLAFECAGVGIASLVVLVISRTALAPAEAFPELLRLPFARKFFG